MNLNSHKSSILLRSYGPQIPVTLQSIQGQGPSIQGVLAGDETTVEPFVSRDLVLTALGVNPRVPQSRMTGPSSHRILPVVPDEGIYTEDLPMETLYL